MSAPARGTFFGIWEIWFGFQVHRDFNWKKKLGGIFCRILGWVEKLKFVLFEAFFSSASRQRFVRVFWRKNPKKKSGAAPAMGARALLDYSSYTPIHACPFRGKVKLTFP